MTASRPILRVGLTGGIASGKTTVAHILAELGAFVLDADALAHELTAPGGRAYQRIVERFGTGILDAGGRIDRPRLATLIFGDERAREALNGILHPEIRDEADRRIEEYAPTGRAPIAVLDAALLVETGAYRRFHKIVVTRCSRESQMRRLLVRDALDPEQAEARLAAQAPLEHKLSVADYVVDTEHTLRETRRQTESVWAALHADFEAEFGAP